MAIYGQFYVFFRNRSMFGLVLLSPTQGTHPTQMLVCCVPIRRRVFLYHGKKKGVNNSGWWGIFSAMHPPLTHPPSLLFVCLFIYLFI
jgi:hypothetical protein